MNLLKAGAPAASPPPQGRGLHRSSIILLFMACLGSLVALPGCPAKSADLLVLASPVVTKNGRGGTNKCIFAGPGQP